MASKWLVASTVHLASDPSRPWSSPSALSGRARRPGLGQYGQLRHGLEYAGWAYWWISARRMVMASTVT